MDWWRPVAWDWKLCAAAGNCISLAGTLTYRQAANGRHPERQLPCNGLTVWEIAMTSQSRHLFDAALALPEKERALPEIAPFSLREKKCGIASGGGTKDCSRRDNGGGRAMPSNAQASQPTANAE